MEDESVDLICDHPYQLTTSLKGGNRNFADYELFQYNEHDFQEKQRVLKPGHFLVEFLPEENGENYQYLFQVKELARKVGFAYYACVPWMKSGFVANTGRKAKNTENVLFFSKGRARDLRPDAKKDKAEPAVKHYMSGAAGMLPTVFDIAPPGKKEKIHQAEKPVELLEQILRFVTKEDELVLDQFAGSGVLGEAALRIHRDSILIEKDEETFQKLTKRLEALGTLEAATLAAKNLISIGTDALVAQEAFHRTRDRDIIYNFAKTHDMSDPAAFYDGERDLRKHATPEQKEAISKAFEAVEDMDLRSQDLDLASNSSELPDLGETRSDREETRPKVLECSSRGDRRFSALFANVTIKGKTQSIEVWYQNAKRTADGKRAGKGKTFDHIVCPFTGDKLPAGEASNLYKGLWITYLSKNPDLVAYAEGFDSFHDMFRRENTVNCQADVIAAYVRDSAAFVSEVRRSVWYQNMTVKKKPALGQRIQVAEIRTPEQMNLFGKSIYSFGEQERSR